MIDVGTLQIEATVAVLEQERNRIDVLRRLAREGRITISQLRKAER